MSALVFWCNPCCLLFDRPDGQPPQSDDETALCPECGTTTEARPERPWMAGLHAAHRTPITDEARAKMKLAGRKGPHPGPVTELGKARSCGNAYRHGFYARRFLVPAARAGRYAACQSCPFAPRETNDAADDTCRTKHFVYCAHQLDIYAEILNAHLTKNPDDLRAFMAEIHASNFVSLRDALHQLAVDGPVIETEIVRTDKDGNPVPCGTRRDPHPALKAVEILGKLVGAEAPQWHMTPKSVKDQETDDKIAMTIADLLAKADAKFMPKPPANEQD